MNNGIIAFEQVEKLLADNLGIMNGVVEKNSKLLNLIYLRCSQNDKQIEEASKNEK